MIEIHESSWEGRAIRILQRIYPITVEELAKELHASDKQVQIVLSSLARKGIIEFDVLPDKKYIRLVRQDIRFIGRKDSQRKKLKHKRPPRPKKKDYEGMMYG